MKFAKEGNKRDFTLVGREAAMWMKLAQSGRKQMLCTETRGAVGVLWSRTCPLGALGCKAEIYFTITYVKRGPEK